MENETGQSKHSFEYAIRSRKGTRGVRIAVHSDGRVVATKSPRVPKILVEAFVRSKTEWIMEQIKELENKPKKLLAHYSAKDFKENKQKAYVLAHNKVLLFNQYYKHEIKNITIRNQRTRWGSCSGKKNLSFNYKIVFLPEELQDYIIVHELCHLKEMNHGKRFWDLVSMQIPDYMKRLKEVKLY